MRNSPRILLLACALVATLPAPAPAQEPYRLPPAEVVALVDAPPTPSVSFSPDGAWMLVEEQRALPSVADLARPMLRLAGMRIDPAANGRYATDFGRRLVLQKVGESGPGTRIPAPAGDESRIGGARWSHDSQRFAYTLVTDAGTELWSATVAEPTRPTMLTDRLNTVVGGFRWMPDGRTLLCNLVPADRGPEPAAPRVPPGPNVQETAGDESPLRTYQDLLASPYDEALFEHYATSELVLLPTYGGAARRVAEPAIWSGADASPDGRYLLLTRVEKPWSYLMPLGSFPETISVLDLRSGESELIEEVPLAEGIPIGGVRTGKRNISWAPYADPMLTWVEALDGGDPDAEAPFRDVWKLCALLSAESPGLSMRVTTELAKVEHRARGLSWLADGRRFITSEYDRDRRWNRTLLHDRDAPGAAPVVLEDRSSNDRYGDPGRLAYRVDDAGNAFVREDDGWLYRVGSGATPEGDLPFLARQSATTGELEELWRCEPGWYESVAELLDEERDGMPVFLTRREAPDMPPNYWWRGGAAEPVQLTAFPDPQPQLRGVHKELVKYERADGVPLSATLYLPAGYQQGERLPLFVWAYPREYNDPSTAGQISGSPWRFTRIASSSHLHLLTQGYAILDGATMPVIGDPETMNDTFVTQIVAAAQAAIDYAVERGVADRERVACGGHSYGAFMTANLLAHCDLFKTGIARSGAYNRTLTPFGFQSERRTFWEAPDAYFNVSPFMHADAIDEPILMIHGEVDNNSGTFPMQSRRMFQAIKGNGGTARLVMLPHESHGYRARESVLHVLAEMIDWLDLHLAATTTAPASAR